MVKEYYEKICAGDEVRASLIALRAELKKKENVRLLSRLAGGRYEWLCALLENGDPKIRKNAALILGEMESADLLLILFHAYQKEETRFIRTDYLKAISKMDYRPLLAELEERLVLLRSSEPAEDEKKHVQEEIRILQAMVMKYHSVSHHRFSGYDVSMEMILVTNRSQREATLNQIRAGRARLLAGGIRVDGARVRDVLPIRTYSELLFPMEEACFGADHPGQAGRRLALSVLRKVRAMHETDTGPFLFRIELKSKVAADKKGVYIRRISAALEEASNGALINSATDYEIEIRLLERKDGIVVPMLKLFTLADQRFSYRKEWIASSVSPVNAALTAELARPYLKEGAQILDPFCGVGTMLIERNHAVRAGVMYGIDIFGEAIEKARRNTEAAGCHVYYIKKDFFEFEHGYLFDEIITDMPQVTAAKPVGEIRSLYLDFFRKAGLHLTPNAVLILYSTEPELLYAAVRNYPEYRIEEKFTVNEKKGTSVFVIRRCVS